MVTEDEFVLNEETDVPDGYNLKAEEYKVIPQQEDQGYIHDVPPLLAQLVAWKHDLDPKFVQCKARRPIEDTFSATDVTNVTDVYKGIDIPNGYYNVFEYKYDSPNTHLIYLYLISPIDINQPQITLVDALQQPSDSTLPASNTTAQP